MSRLNPLLLPVNALVSPDFRNVYGYAGPMTERLSDCACGCGSPVLYRGGRPGKFASTACRMRAHRRSTQGAATPSRMRSADRWVRHSARKVPLTVTGRVASSTDSATWSTHRAAKASTAGVGLGFVLNGDGIVCIDLDHCLTDGVVTPAAQRILDAAPGAWVEVSPGGDGLHLWGVGVVAQGRKTTFDGQAVEVYGSGRFITVTGRVFRRGGLADLSGVLSLLMA